MRTEYRNWDVRGELREATEDMGDGGPPVRLGYSEMHVRIDTGDGTVYEVVLTEGNELVGLTIRRKGLTRTNLRDVPLGELHAVATEVLERFDFAAVEDELPTGTAETLAGWGPGEHRCPDDAEPTLGEFARLWETHPKGGRVRGKLYTTRRDYLAARLGKSKSTVDVWTRKARAEGHLPPATTGRPKAEPGDDAAS